MRPSILLLTAASGLASAAWHKLPGHRDLVGGGGSFPRETGCVGADESQGWTPKPTPAPDSLSESDTVLELLRARAATNTWENEKTCGWTVGQSSAPFTCQSSLTCATNNQNIVGCVSGTSSSFFNVCLDMEAFKQGACSSIGPATGCCQSPGFGACGTFLWTGTPTKSMYRCFPTPTIISLQDEPQFVIDARTSTTPSSSSAATSTTSPTPTPAPDDDNDKPATPIGAIVGGVVGGIAVLALLAGLAAWMLARKRRTAGSRTQTYNAVPNPSDPPYPPQAHPGKGYGYANIPGSATTFPPNSPYPTNATMSPAPAYDFDARKSSPGQGTFGGYPSPHAGQPSPGSPPVHGGGFQQQPILNELDSSAGPVGSHGNPVEIGSAR